MARGFNYAPGSSAEVERARQPVVHKTELAVLAASKNSVVKEALARRDDLPLGVMVTLAHDRHTEVRAALATNPHITEAILDHLVGDRHAEVLEGLLTNPALPVALVEKLAFHKRDSVRSAAADRLNADAANASPRHDDSGTGPLTTYHDRESEAEGLRWRNASEHVEPATQEPALSTDELPTAPMPQVVTEPHHAEASGQWMPGGQEEAPTPSAEPSSNVVRFPEGTALTPPTERQAAPTPQERPTRTAPIRGFKIS
ncbi:hypothetical protein ON058_03405 [Demequina sp. B12]|uniref:hypothetical protein n=1 Tax=Demequina sp. B12 TaxID=2992757 RepID=UPI00237BECBB|nr:hypothetical protein [Demequina sp. B12]MDE0572455.1 hypothetical protein [Demequina sp. B12]